MNILLTGGAGYIGSHAAIVLTEAGHNVTIFENFCNSHYSVIDVLNRITGKKLMCIEGDIRETEFLSKTLRVNKIDAVMHFAGLKAVGESTEKPILYYDNNVGGTISLLNAMQENNIKTLVFSSSATVYGDPQYLPIDEKHPLSATNPYGSTKIYIENILDDLCKSDNEWSVVSLRYFNPIGKHKSGLLNESPKGTPNNIMPILLKVASGEIEYLNIYGNSYKTKDGSGVRDYIHIEDLAAGHIAGLDYIKNNKGYYFFNLGTGEGTSVMELIKVFEEISNKKIKIKIAEKRLGDIAISFASADKASTFLKWKSKKNIFDACESLIK
jgi:UDP-glucose 4-epimerase